MYIRSGDTLRLGTLIGVHFSCQPLQTKVVYWWTLQFMAHHVPTGIHGQDLLAVIHRRGPQHHLVNSILIVVVDNHALLILVVVEIVVFGVYVITIASFALFCPFGIDLGTAGAPFTRWDGVSKPIVKGFPRCRGLAVEGPGMPSQLLLCNK